MKKCSLLLCSLSIVFFISLFQAYASTLQGYQDYIVYAPVSRIMELGNLVGNFQALEDYGNYFTGSFSTNSIKLLSTRGIEYEVLYPYRSIQIGDHAFDPLVQKVQSRHPLLKPLFQDTISSFQLVQFQSPVKSSWLKKLKLNNMHLVGPIPYYTYLVYCEDPSIIRFLRDYPYIRTITPFSPVLKISNNTLNYIEKVDPTTLTEFIVSMYQPGFTLDQFRNLLENKGYYWKSGYHKGNFCTGIIELEAQYIVELLQMEGILGIERYLPPEIEGGVGCQINAGNHTGYEPYPGYEEWLKTIGVNGGDVTVAVVDDGVDSSDTLHFGNRITDILGNAYPGAQGHGHHVAGIIGGDCSHKDKMGFKVSIGVAPGVSILNIPLLAGYGGTFSDVCKDSVTIAGSNGEPALIQNNSWGAGMEDPMTYGCLERDYDGFVRDADPETPGNQELVICFSAGNAGDKGLTRPKAAKNIITVGAIESYQPYKGNLANDINQVTYFSSRGNCQDNRIKPDICTPGTWISSTRAGDNVLWGNIDDFHRFCSGTSQAVPYVTGAAALIEEWWAMHNEDSYASPALIKAILINTADDLQGANAPPPIPNMFEGWGRLNLKNVFSNIDPTNTIDQTVLFTANSDEYIVKIMPENTSIPLKITLVWTDAPTVVNASPALVNDLDLVVTQGDLIYYGNNFENGFSYPGGDRDTINNVENVFLKNPIGVFTITIRASNLLGDGVPGNNQFLDQDFALIISNGTTDIPPMKFQPGRLHKDTVLEQDSAQQY